MVRPPREVAWRAASDKDVKRWAHRDEVIQSNSIIKEWTEGVMPDAASIAFQMGPATEDFHRYWEEELGGKTVSHAKFRPERKSAAGAGLALPPEVTIVVSELIQNEFVKEAIAGAGGAIGAGVGKFVWAKLKGFFKRPQKKEPPERIIVVINRRQFLIFTKNMPSDPPKEFLDAIG